jgi:hypothetical protein
MIIPKYYRYFNETICSFCLIKKNQKIKARQKFTTYYYTREHIVSGKFLTAILSSFFSNKGDGCITIKRFSTRVAYT